MRAAIAAIAVAVALGACTQPAQAPKYQSVDELIEALGLDQPQSDLAPPAGPHTRGRPAAASS